MNRITCLEHLISQTRTNAHRRIHMKRTCSTIVYTLIQFAYIVHVLGVCWDTRDARTSCTIYTLTQCIHTYTCTRATNLYAELLQTEKRTPLLVFHCVQISSQNFTFGLFGCSPQYSGILRNTIFFLSQSIHNSKLLQFFYILILYHVYLGFVG